MQLEDSLTYKEDDDRKVKEVLRHSDDTIMHLKERVGILEARANAVRKVLEE